MYKATQGLCLTFQSAVLETGLQASDEAHAIWIQYSSQVLGSNQVQF